MLKVLVGCEFSGVVRDAFLAAGHDAISCDLLPTDSQGPHMACDVMEAVLSQKWDIIILHPPCTALAVSGNSTYGYGCKKHDLRLVAVTWTKKLFDTALCQAVVGVALENPVGVLPRMAGMECSQYIHPWMFGHMEQKKKGLWLHNLPPLVPTIDVYKDMLQLPKSDRERIHYMPPSKDRWKMRSITYQGIADAMASQWGGL